MNKHENFKEICYSNYDFNDVKNKRNKFFQHYSENTNITYKTLNTRKFQRNEIFSKKRKFHFKTFYDESIHTNKENIKKSKILTYINDFLTDNIDRKIYGLKCIKKVLSLESTEKIEKKLLKKGVIQEIMNFSVELNKDIYLEYLSFLSIFTHKNNYFDHIFFTKISSLISSENTEINELLLMILSNLLYNLNDFSNFEEVIICHVFHKLVKIITETRIINILLPSLNCLFNILVTSKAESLINLYFKSLDNASQFIQYYITILTQFSTDIEILSYIYPVLTLLLKIYKEKVAKLYHENTLMKTIIFSLYIPINDSRTSVLRLLYNLINYANSELIDLLISNKIIEKLGEFLDSDNLSIQKVTCKILELLAKENGELGLKITDRKILNLIYKNLYHLNANKEHFLRIINSLFSNIRDKEALDRIDQKELLSIIGKLICTNSNSLIISSLDLFIILLDLDCSFNKTSNLIPYIIKIGLDSKIEKLAYNPDKSIYERVSKLLIYFNQMTD